LSGEVVAVAVLVLLAGEPTARSNQFENPLVAEIGSVPLPAGSDR
jgi:hypothetical protein